MPDPTEPGGPDHRAYCFLDRERQCRGDCVSFDTNGVRDTSGRLTSCRLLNDIAGVRAATITIGNHFKAKKEPLTGSEFTPPKVGG